MDSINDILASLTPDDINNLKETAESIFGAGGQSNKGNSPPPPSGGFDLGKLDPEMFSRIGKIMSAMNSDGGKRCRLIEALKPNLSPSKQKKADEAMQIMKIMEVMPLLSDFMNKGDGNACK